MDKYNFWAGLAIMAGLIMAGAMIPAAVGKFRAADRTVSVKGLCEREVPADKVIWPIKYKVVGDDLSSVITEIERKNAAITKFITGGGIPESEITISAPSISDKFTQEYGSNDRAFRYVVTNTLTVCSTEVQKVLDLMGKQSSLLKAGIALEASQWDGAPVFSFEGLNDIKPEMIQEATRNAREVALKFAADSNSKLGKIRSATQGTFSIESRDSNTPQIKKVRVVTNVVYYLHN
ncbi:MAG: SIMPL domain-containing protein [Bacteroidales bacterium]|nr:SIMPL domain-containing protein [Bacteroidales bacterium]